MIKIVSLNSTMVSYIVRRLNEIFPPGSQQESEREEILASLFPDDHSDFLKQAGILPSLRYWVVVDEAEKILGMVGLYRCYDSDPSYTSWLGWFFVIPEARKRGIGTKLLLFAINKAKRRGDRILKLYTSTRPEELDSHRLYLKHGFKLVGEEAGSEAGEIKILYFELNLKTQAS